MSKDIKSLSPSDLNHEDVVMTPPDLLGKGDRLSKIHHKQGKKLVVKMRVSIVRKQDCSSRHSIIFVRIKSEVRDLLLGLDETVIQQTCANVDPWFLDEETKKPKIRASMVHEYFQSSLSVTKEGTLGKFHLLNNQLDIQEGDDYDVNMHLYGVRFLKTSFYLTWKLDTATRIGGSSDSFIADDIETEPPIAPLPTEAEAIRDSLRSQARNVAELLEQKKHATESQMQALLKLYERMKELEGSIDGAHVHQFNDVHGLLQQIGTEI